MVELMGKHNKAVVYAETIDNETVSQIIGICNMEPYAQNKIRIMPDCHAGAGCVIGTTMSLENDCVTPNMVGVDIGCGMAFQKVKMPEDVEATLRKVDEAIRKYVPAGMNVRETPFPDYYPKIKEMLNSLQCRGHINIQRAELAVGSLGGGNHFVEISGNSDGETYLIVHSGSRYLGKQVAEFYQDMAELQHKVDPEERKAVIEELKAKGRQHEIQDALKELYQRQPKYPKEVLWVSGRMFNEYLHDLKIAQEYASLNRRAIIQVILENTPLESRGPLYETIHNYIDIDERMMRKGAVSAKKDELLLIPMNMRDGSLLCKGKGNPDWNFSAPHGAGRRLSRNAAKASITLEQYEESMKGIFTTSVSSATIDEAPDAYKPMEEIVDIVRDAVEIIDVLKPIYNFKAAD